MYINSNNKTAASGRRHCSYQNHTKIVKSGPSQQTYIRSIFVAMKKAIYWLWHHLCCKWMFRHTAMRCFGPAGYNTGTEYWNRILDMIAQTSQTSDSGNNIKLLHSPVSVQLSLLCHWKWIETDQLSNCIFFSSRLFFASLTNGTNLLLQHVLW